jgi:PrsW family intramembrane metalloprotease
MDRRKSGHEDGDGRKNKKRKRSSSRDHSIFAEPTQAAMDWLNNQKMKPKSDPRHDQAESSARARIDDEHLGESFAEEAERSVFDEPTYSKELAGEVPLNALTYEKYLAEQLDATTVFESWFWTAVLASMSGLLAILGTFASSFIFGLESRVQFLAIVVFAPVVEEVMKTALLLWCVEQKPYLFRSPMQLIIIGAFSGLMFAAAENILYLKVYIDEPSMFIIVWRWTVCVALHMTTTSVASIGLVLIWRRVMQTGKFANAELGARYLLAAIVLHGGYNATMVLVEYAGLF